MPDQGHILTDKMLNDLENRIADEYAKASRSMQKKFQDYMEQFKAGEAKQKALLDAGKITKDDYNNWRFRHEAMGKRWEQMKDVLAADMENARNIALKIAGERMPDVYALNANYATYQIEYDGRIDTSFVLYNHDAAEYLVKDTRQLMPPPSAKKAAEIAANKTMQWDKQKIQSAVLQGILQGESPHKVAERLRGVAEMGYNASVRYARTMTTSAQNAGRYESYRRAKRMGVDLTIEWEATLDDRTRHAHRQMHGQRTTVDEPFYTPDGYTIYYPGDCTGSSDAPQREIWNCRCTLLAWVKGFESDTVKSSPKMHDMTFEEWQQSKPIPDSQSDRQQFKEYQQLLGKRAPKKLEEFRDTKYNKPEAWEKLKADARQRRSDLNGANAPIKFKDSQFGKKAGKHAADYGLDPKSTEDRDKLKSIIRDIRENRSEVRRGQWRGQTVEVFFHIKGEDVVITKPAGEFITIMKVGVENERVKNARRIKI